MVLSVLTYELRRMASIFIHSFIYSLTQHTYPELLFCARKLIGVSLSVLQGAFTYRSHEFTSLLIPAEARVTHSRQEADGHTRACGAQKHPLWTQLEVCVQKGSLGGGGRKEAAMDLSLPKSFLQLREAAS